MRNLDFFLKKGHESRRGTIWEEERRGTGDGNGE
jgi:hypothetical protein